MKELFVPADSKNVIPENRMLKRDFFDFRTIIFGNTRRLNVGINDDYLF